MIARPTRYGCATTGETINDLIVGGLRRDLIGDLSGDVLDIGIGTGLNLLYYGRKVHVVGLEPQRDQLATAQARPGPPRDLLAASAHDLPFVAESFVVVVTTMAFCSIPDPRHALDEIRRVLKPGGRLLQMEHTRTEHRLADAFLDQIAPVWCSFSGGCRPNRDTAALLRDAGWHVERHERHLGGLVRVLVSTPS